MYFFASKLAWLVFKPESWIVIGTGVVCIALFTKQIHLARTVGMITFVLVLSIAILPIGQLLMRPLELRHWTVSSPEVIDGIIVLGGDFDTRSLPALALASKYPSARLVYTGLSEPTWVEGFFSSFGLPPDRLVVEPNARNTIENARLSYRIASPSPGSTWLLVTSAIHMPRALATFKRAGWKSLEPYPVDFQSPHLIDGIGWNLARNLDLLNRAIKEYVGIAAYRILGYM